MENQTDYKKFAVLYVDDETQSLSLFRQAFEDEFRIFTAASATEGLKILEAHADEIGVLMTDQRMPGEKGVWLLERARLLCPRILRILATAYTDMDAAIQAVNSGQIFKYISKPWDPLLVEQTIKRGLEFFELQAERDQLLKEKRTFMRERMLASRMVSLGLVSAGLNHHLGNRLQTVKILLDLVESGQHDSYLLKKSKLDLNEILGLLADLQIVSGENANGGLTEEIQLPAAIGRLMDEWQTTFAARQLSVVHDIPETLPALRSQPVRFKRLLELLFKYEVAHLPAGSRLQLRAAEEIVNGKPGLALELADNGPTLPQEALRLVMDPLVIRGQPSEYSINLMVCFFIVRQHGGSIEAKALPGGGNIFILRLPLQPEPAVLTAEDSEFLQRAFFNEQRWEKILTRM
jgi:two-component system, probable response regulator PhcQ